MTTDLLLVLGLLASAITMFALNRPRMDAVALLMLVALPLTGVLSMGEALAGFSDPNVVLIAALFVIGEGLVRTGVARSMGDWLIRRAGKSETRLLVWLMVIVGGLGSVMSSTGVVAIFIPIVLRIARNTGLAPARLMMPLSFAALISGMMTLVATAPNLVVNAELAREGHQGFHFFSFTPFGIPLLAIGIGYMLFARRWLAAGTGTATEQAPRPNLLSWVEQYKLAGRAHRLLVRTDSPLAGKRLGELDLRGSAGVNLIAIERTHRFAYELLRPAAKTELLAGDVLLIDLFETDVTPADLSRRYALDPLPLTGAYFTDHAQEVGMVEVLLPAESKLVGRTVVETRFRTVFGLAVVGLRRGSVAHESGLLREKLRTGDTLLLVGSWKDIRRLQSDSRDFLVLNLPSDLDEIAPAARQGPWALACLALVVGLMISGVVPNVQAALIGCLLMGATRCIDFSAAYNAIHWKSLILIVGMLPFSLALQRTGGVTLASDALLAAVGGAGAHVMLASLFIITALIGLFISNTATAVLMAPVALAMAAELKASPYPFAMIVALAASCAFMTPISSPVNTLVLGPGNYRFGDFVRVGVPFTVLALIVTVLLVPWLLPLW